jgi:hypothetical protein
MKQVDLLPLFWTFGPLILFIIASKSSSSKLKKAVKILKQENSSALDLLKSQMINEFKIISVELDKLKSDTQGLFRNYTNLLNLLSESEKKILTSTQNMISESQEQIQSLSQNIDNLEERISQLQDNQNFVRATSYIKDNSDQESEYLLDLPLEKILDIYHESSQVLEPICKRVALSANNDNLLILERNAQGNYWVLQLADQGFFLLPRTAAFVRISALESMQKLFETEGETSNIENYQFIISRPAKLNLLKRNLRWQLTEKGLINLGESPLEFRWQQEIRKIRQDYEKINSLLEPLEKDGAAASFFELTKIKQEVATLSRQLSKTIELVSKLAKKSS